MTWSATRTRPACHGRHPGDVRHAQDRPGRSGERGCVGLSDRGGYVGTHARGCCYLRRKPDAAGRRRVPAAGPAAGPGRTDRTVIGLVAGVVLAGLVGWLGFPDLRGPAAGRRSAICSCRRRRMSRSTSARSTISTPTLTRNESRTRRPAGSRTASPTIGRRTSTAPPAPGRRLLGTVTDAGLESQSGDQGRVLVAVTVKSADPAQEPQFLRMRLTVQKMGDVRQGLRRRVRVMTPRRSVNWSRVLVYGLLPGLALLLAMSAGMLKWKDSSIRDIDAGP